MPETTENFEPTNAEVLAAITELRTELGPLIDMARAMTTDPAAIAMMGAVGINLGGE